MRTRLVSLLPAALTVGLVVLADCAAGPTHGGHRARRAEIMVVEDLRALPAGPARVRICVGSDPCTMQHLASRQTAGPLLTTAVTGPDGVAALRLSGLRVLASAVSGGRHFEARGRLVYHVPVDPGCGCGGTSAGYLRFR